MLLPSVNDNYYLLTSNTCYVVTHKEICCKHCNYLIYRVYHDKYATILTHHATFL
jgi:hypothetical protein